MINRERLSGGPEEQFSFDNTETCPDDVTFVGPNSWERLADGGGDKHRARGPEARRGIRRDAREEASRSPRFRKVLKATGALAEKAAEVRSKRE